MHNSTLSTYAILQKIRYNALFARAFTKFEANKSQGALLEQLQKDAILSSGTMKYFPSVAGEIQKAYIEILSEVGL